MPPPHNLHPLTVYIYILNPPPPTTNLHGSLICRKVELREEDLRREGFLRRGRGGEAECEGDGFKIKAVELHGADGGDGCRAQPGFGGAVAGPRTGGDLGCAGSALLDGRCFQGVF